ncbi:uncharacterized protein LOC141800374 [Halichoeres trimaculatus]|uniref:uncharacterized protein LOC141800374 n=1 Tax=Halichoeres trimaculatus TaxID=147232 RepID=UPI003D9EF574
MEGMTRVAHHFLLLGSLSALFDLFTPSVCEQQRQSSKQQCMDVKMSVFNRLAPLIPKASNKQVKEQPSVCLSPPLPLSSPVIKKKPIKIPSFDEKGLISETHSSKHTQSDRTFVPICSSKTPSPPCWSKSCHHSQRLYGERASTLPRTKPKTCNPPTLNPKPSISISPAPNSSPTLHPKPRDSHHPPTSHLCEPSPLLHQPPPKPSVSPTLIVPTPRLSPSPTSLCADSRGGKQPSPVAQERRARSITISNSSKLRPTNEAKHDVLDQAALLDFTHPALRRASSMTSGERPAGMSQNSCSMQGKVCVTKREHTARDKAKLLCGNKDLSTIPKPKLSIKQQQELLHSGDKRAQILKSEAKFGHNQRELQSMFDGKVANLQRKYTDFTHTHTRGFTSNDRSNEGIYSERQVTPRMSFSTEPPLNQSAVSPNIELRRRQFDSNDKTKANTTFLPSPSLRRPQVETKNQTGNSSELFRQNIIPPQRNRLWSSQTSQIDVKSAVIQSDCVSKDYQAGTIDQKTEAQQCTHRLNPLKTCLVAPQSQEASSPASVESTASKRDATSPNHLLDHKQQKNSDEVKLCDTGVTQTGVRAPSGHPSEECDVSWPSSVTQCLFNTNSFGSSSKGLFDHKAGWRPKETIATSVSPSQQKLSCNPAGRAFIMEEAEDPYYVTMYYPGSVYVGGGHSNVGVVTEDSRGI